MITEQDLPCIGASIFDADTYASSKPTSLGWLPASHIGEPTIRIRSRRRGLDFLNRFCVLFCSFSFFLFQLIGRRDFQICEVSCPCSAISITITVIVFEKIEKKQYLILLYSIFKKIFFENTNSTIMKEYINADTQYIFFKNLLALK